MGKANHKHQYVLHRKPLPGEDRWTLIKVCSVCGFTKQPSFKSYIIKLESGYYKMLHTEADFEERYGKLPIYSGGDKQ